MSITYDFAEQDAILRMVGLNVRPQLNPAEVKRHGTCQICLGVELADAAGNKYCRTCEVRKASEERSKFYRDRLASTPRVSIVAENCAACENLLEGPHVYHGEAPVPNQAQMDGDAEQWPQPKTCIGCGDPKGMDPSPYCRSCALDKFR